MFEDLFGELLDGLDAALQQLAAVDLTRLDASSLALGFQRLEAHSRRRDSLEHVLVAEIDTRGLPSEAGCRSTQAYLQALSNIAPADARQRVVCAQNLAPGRTLTGEPVPAIFPAVARAEAAGELSRAHARVITDCIDKLPDAVAADYDRHIEAVLVGEAPNFDPTQLARYARKLAFTFDQDGVLADEAYRDRVRGLHLFQRADGSGNVQGDLTAPCMEALLVVMDSLAAPRPASDGVSDTRSAAARHHDALLDALNRLLVDGGLPMTGGVSATILLTMTEDSVREQAQNASDGSSAANADSGHDHIAHRPDRQLVRLGHGALISLAMALKIATDAQIIPIIFKGAREIAAYGETHRIASPNQRFALIARDKGCSFPGCGIPPAWCQTHHVTEFQLSRKTRVDDLTLLCGYHHRMFEKLGWACYMINGFPNWTPPPWVDASQTPRRNTAHI